MKTIAIKKIYLNIIIVTITIFLASISTSLITNDIKHIRDYNNMYLKNNISVIIHDNKEQILKELSKNNDISIISKYSELLNGAITQGVYFNNTPIQIPVDIGRNLTCDDIKNNSNYIIIGEKFKNLITEQNNKKYINIFGENYEVIGITNNDILKNGAFINLELIDEEFQGNEFVICSNSLANDELLNIIHEYEEKNTSYIEVVEEIGTFSIKNIFERYSDVIEIYVVIMSISILAFVISTLYLADKLKNEINIRILCGATYGEILLLLVRRSSFITLISICISVIAQILLSKIPLTNVGYYDINVYNFIVFFVVGLLSTSILIIGFLKGIKSQSISSVLKEN